MESFIDRGELGFPETVILYNDSFGSPRREPVRQWNIEDLPAEQQARIRTFRDVLAFHLSRTYSISAYRPTSGILAGFHNEAQGLERVLTQ
jgi:hypothetical protein